MLGDIVQFATSGAAAVTWTSDLVTTVAAAALATGVVAAAAVVAADTVCNVVLGTGKFCLPPNSPMSTGL